MKKPYLIGIAGGSASGKSTLCDRLEKALNPLSVKAFHMDAYFKPVHERPYLPAPFTGAFYVDDNCPDTVDLPRLRQDVADALTQGWDVVLVEGLLTLWDEPLCKMLDLKLFVDCRADERIVRRLRRNMAGGLTFDEIASVYLDMVRYRHDEYVEPSRWRADLVLNGSIPSEKALKAVVGLARDYCREGR